MSASSVSLESGEGKRWLSWRRRNRRVRVQRKGMMALLGESVAKAGRALRRPLRLAGQVLLLLVLLAGCAWSGRWAITHVINSPQFQLGSLEFQPTPHLGEPELLELAGVSIGDKLLGIDTDQVAARIATHPWVAKVRVSRRLPSVLVVELTERRAVALAELSGLYLVDDNGHPFKHATMAEADGLPVLTGIERSHYASLREVSEAAMREALAVLAQYRSKPNRPAVGEVNIDPGFGFSLFLDEGGAEIRLGRGNLGKKLAQLDQILDAALDRAGGASAIRIVHLDAPESGRVPVLFRATPPASPKPAQAGAARPAKS
ncbi:MAG: FtsQ-type POTRA domain-containing protein [Polyangia bacterium]